MWQTLKGDHLDMSIADRVRFDLERDRQMGYQLQLCIGSDSQVYGHHIVFATAVVVLRRGAGGYMYQRKELVNRNMALRERLMQEVHLSVQTALELCDVAEQFQIGMEVHADINSQPGFQSHQALRDAMGYILGMGYVFKAKPHAFASSSCANKVV